MRRHDGALGYKGKMSGGVYQVSIAHAEHIQDVGMDVPEAMGSAIGINFQPTGPGKTAVMKPLQCVTGVPACVEWRKRT